MTDNCPLGAMNALDDLLEAEREALLSGDLESLARMLPAKQALFDAMNGSDPSDAVSLRKLDVKVRRNQLLLDGALAGIRNVAGRLATMRRMRNTLETYGSDGRKHSIDVEADHSVEKRA